MSNVLTHLASYYSYTKLCKIHILICVPNCESVMMCAVSYNGMIHHLQVVANLN